MMQLKATQIWLCCLSLKRLHISSYFYHFFSLLTFKFPSTPLKTGLRTYVLEMQCEKRKIKCNELIEREPVGMLRRRCTGCYDVMKSSILVLQPEAAGGAPKETSAMSRRRFSPSHLLEKKQSILAQ